MLSNLFSFALAETQTAAASSVNKTVAIVLGVILMVIAVAIIVVVLLQSNNHNKLSGTITGSSSDTFFSKSAGSTKDKGLSRLTLVLSIVMAVLVVATYIYVS